MFSNLIIAYAFFLSVSPNGVVCEKDFKEVVMAVVNDSRMDYFLIYHATHNSGIYFKYYKDPLCNGMAVPRVKFDFPYKEKAKITYSSKPLTASEKPSRYKIGTRESPKEVVIVIDYLEIKGKRAEINFRIPAEGVHGTYSLNKQVEWEIVKADVYET